VMCLPESHGGPTGWTSGFKRVTLLHHSSTQKVITDATSRQLQQGVCAE